MTDLIDRPFLYQEPPDDQPDETDRGLVYDLGTLDRRRMLQLLGFGGISAGMFVIAGCTPGAGASPSASASAAASAAAGASCAVIPEETAGPFPGDGSNGPDVLNQSGVVRKDIRSSFGSSTTTAQGVPLTIQLTIQDATDCAPIAGAAVYLWHCDRDGNYSLYSQAAANENYLRGVQEADADGVVTFDEHLPGVLLGTLAARPLRGLSEPRHGDQREQQDRDLADRVAQGHLRPGLRDRRLRPERARP